MSEELCLLSASALLEGYRTQALSPVEVTKAVLARIESLNPRLNAFNLVSDQALEEAKASQARWLSGQPKGLLDGVPVSIKDLILTRGWPTLRGSKTVNPKGPWNEDAPATARFREHGAVLIGKTTTPEFGWKGVTDSPLTGITRNPWNPSKTPGGSSGGAAVAVACGMGPLAVGTDGGGSIRIPSSFTGIFGIKPSFGRVPAWPLSPFGTVAHVGPMTRHVADAALMLSVMSLPDAIGVCADLGAGVDERHPGFENAGPIFQTHWFSGAAALIRTVKDRQPVDPGLLEMAEQGAKITAAELIDAQMKRGALGMHMNLFHRDYDLLVTPTLAVAAFDVGQETPVKGRWTEWTPFTYPFNLTGQPAASIPCGLTKAGLPVGLQIVGPRFADALVLRAARAFETARPVALPELSRLLS